MQHADFTEYEISLPKDFDLRQILECGQCFRWNENTEEEDSENIEDYTLMAGSSLCRAVQKGNGQSGSAVLQIRATGGSEDFWRNYFDLSTDYGEIKNRLRSREPRLEEPIRYGFGIRILRQEFWEVLISFIVSQNNNIPRIKKCIEALCTKYGEEFELPDGSVFHSFPEPESLAAADEEDIRALRLGYRSGYITAAARQFIDDGVPSGSEPDQMNELRSYLGIGPKVANCISLFGLRNLDAFPIDTWVKKIMNDMYGFDQSDVRGMTAFAADKFGDLGGMAQQYLFYYYRDRQL